MFWVIGFIVCWILFIILVDKRNIRVYVWGGILTLVTATIVDWGAQKLGLYLFTNKIIDWFGCSIFYKFGPNFTMGILFAQSIPRNKFMQVLNIFAFTLFFLSFEYLALKAKHAYYIHWHIVASFIFDLLIFTSLSWFSLVFLKPKAS